MWLHWRTREKKEKAYRRIVGGVCGLLANPPFQKKKKRKKKTVQAPIRHVARRHLVNQRRSKALLKEFTHVSHRLPFGRGRSESTNQAHSFATVANSSGLRMQLLLANLLTLSALVSTFSCPPCKLSRKQPTTQPSIFESLAQAANVAHAFQEDDYASQTWCLVDENDRQITVVQHHTGRLT